MSSLSYKTGFYEGWVSEATRFQFHRIPEFKKKTEALRRLLSPGLFLPDFDAYRFGFHNGAVAAHKVASVAINQLSIGYIMASDAGVDDHQPVSDVRVRADA